MDANHSRLYLLAAMLVLAVSIISPAMAATTQVQIVKYANDNTTILNQTTVNYTWMEANLPVLGDGTTHYYHQGPVFVDNANETLEQELRWNAAEDTNVLEKDMGAVKGTNVKDLCDLVGGMSSGEQVKLLASDGWNMWFAYENVYEYSSREGPIGICWYKNGQYPDTGYSDGMRMVWFADDSVNTLGPGGTGVHAFGNYDWHEAAAPEYWYYYIQGSENYPTTTGISGQVINRVYIYSDEAPPVPPTADFTADVTSGTAPLTVQFTDQSTGDGITGWAWDFENDGIIDSTDQNPEHIYDTSGTYTVNLTVTNAGGSDDEVKADYITVTDSTGWNLDLIGVSEYTMPNTEFEALAAAYPVSWTDGSSNVWNGTALWRLIAIVDDGDPATFNDTFATEGYSIKIVASDGFSKIFNSADIARNDSRIIANIMNGDVLPENRYPLRFVGPGLSGSQMVSKIVRIELFLTITANADTGGIIEPSGPVYVPYDGSQTFDITPDSGYHVADVLVDGVSVGPVTSYDFTNVTASHTIDAGFAADEGAPVADFTADVTSGTAPLTVQFTDASTGDGITDWAWDFENDGILDDTNQSPSHVYDTAGTYTVNLTVTNATGSGSEVKADYITVSAAQTITELFNGTVTLTPGETFNVTAYNSGTEYTINRTTPLGALDEVAMLEGFIYNVTDKRWSSDQVLLLDDVDGYIRNTPGNWLAYVNNVYKDGYGNHADGLNVIELVSGDHVDFYYAAGVVDKANLTETISKATAAVKTTITIEGSPPSGSDWSLSLTGARSQSVTKSFFEQGLACPSSGHMVNWTDGDGAEWSGVPLWLLVAMVDDNPDVGPDHYNFNDALAAQGYSVKVTAGDGYNTTLASADIARNNDYIVANKLNGTDLPLLTPGGKLSWPLHLKGSAVFGGQQVGNITSIELTGMPQPPQGWTLTLEGDVVDVISQEYFEEAIACHHNVTYTDGSGSVWTGVPLWDLVGAVDDIETASHWTFNDTRANVTGYTVRVIAADGYNRTFPSLNVSHNNGFIVANTLNGSPLSGTNGNLKLVGPATTSSGQRVSNITIIRLEGLPSYPAGEYSLSLKGRISDVIPQPELEEWIAANTETYTDGSENEYSGIPLWRLLAWVDDRIPAGSNAFNDDAAAAGYKIIVKAGDGYSKEFLSGAVARSNDYIVANTLNGSALPNDGSHPPWPLRLVGAGAAGSSSVGNIAEIELTDFATVETAAPVHIIKYGPDGVTIVNETNVTYQWMEANLPVIGDGSTVYRFEAITNNPANIWDPEETYPGGFKIENAVKGSRIHDLCELVGGMGTGTDIKLVASDGYETTLPYSSVYTNPAVQDRQGDAVLAWWADGQYVPYYSDGMRLFFMPDDHIYGQWDMNQTLPANYHHFYFQDGIFYPSCAGLSAKYITTIKIYSEPTADWTLELDGRDIGGMNATISKTYFEQALACQFGANHSVTYTDSSGREWGGMPLWFLCGFVDDADQHSDNAYNEAKALAGYNITITGSDGYNYTFDSRDTVRNANYIVANTLNGTPIPEGDSSWPLRMAGQNVSGGKVVRKIASIRLAPSSQTTVSVVPATVGLPIDTTQDVQLVANSLPQGLAGYELVVSLENPGPAQIVGVSYPAWAIVSNTTSLPASSVKISGVDLNKSVQAGALNVPLATITLRGIDAGSTPIVLSGVTMDADGGAIITPLLLEGQANVYSEITANFTANRTSGMASENVTFAVDFTCLSTGNPAPSAWHWEFGNGAVSSLEDPVCSYNAPGEYAVTLNVSNAYTSDSLTRDDYIVITPYVEAFPGYIDPPTTTGMTDDYLIYDINGNGRLDFDDVVAYYQNMQWIRDNTRVGIEPYDYNQNDRIDFDDVVLLYDMVLST